MFLPGVFLGNDKLRTDRFIDGHARWGDAGSGGPEEDNGFKYGR